MKGQPSAGKKQANAGHRERRRRDVEYPRDPVRRAIREFESFPDYGCSGDDDADDSVAPYVDCIPTGSNGLIRLEPEQLEFERRQPQEDEE